MTMTRASPKARPTATPGAAKGMPAAGTEEGSAPTAQVTPYQPSGTQVTGGESLAAFSDRVRRALTAVAAEHPGGVVLIGTHGTFAGRTLSATGHSVGWGFLKTMPMPAVHRVQWGGDHPIEATGPGL